MTFRPGGDPVSPIADTAQGAADRGDLARPPDRPDTGPVPGAVTRFARRHGLFGAVLLAGAAVRVIALLGIRGPLWTPDSTRYIQGAVQLAPSSVRPSGYSVMLWLLEPLHSLTAVVALQHLMGLAIGVTGYALLRRTGLPGWGAAAAMVPVLLSAYAIQLEHFIMSDTLFALLVMIAVAVMPWWPTPPVWACALAGLLLAAAALSRSEGIPLLIVFLVFLVSKSGGWRTAASVLVMSAAFAIPVAGYAAWYDLAHGTFELTSSTGAFLYGGVATFADCAKIKPPDPERQLCINVPVSERKWPDFYIWSGPISSLPGGPFGQRADSLGKSFALQAIRAQPLDYLRTVSHYFWKDFLPPPSIHSHDIAERNRAQHLNEFMFPVGSPRQASPQTARDFSKYDLGGPGARVVQPYAGWIRAYQRYIIVPGPLLGAIVLGGLGGLTVAWRRFGGPALLPWLVGLCLLAAPAAIAESYPRYLVSDVPLFCVAAALGIQQIAGAAKRSRGGPKSRWRRRLGPRSGRPIPGSR